MTRGFVRVAQLFISHSSADNDLALRVRERLTGLGYESIFLDVSGPDGLVPGAAWRDQLFTNLDRCQALVLVVTPSSNASKWCHSEVALARWLRKPVLALLVDDAPPHELVADLQGVKVGSADVSAEALRTGLLALGLDQEAAWDPSRSPFPGLRPLDESYAPVFFGRERQIEELRQLVDPPSRLRQGLVLPVLGPSGSGKSSLVRAGLVAALRRTPDWVVTEPWTPSDVPMAELTLALSHAAKRHDVSISAEECGELLAAPGGLTEYVRRLRAAGDLPATARVLVVVDQAEELVTLTGEAERTALFSALSAGIEQPSPLRVVMTARTDLWDQVAAAASRAGLEMAPTVLHVPPLSRSDLARVISEPARRANLTLEPGLLERLLEDTGKGDALPLLAFTLSRLTALAEDGVLTNAGYDSLGGVRGAIASRAAAVARGTRTEEQVAAAVLQLVGTAEGHPAARLARVESVPPDQRAILDDLVEARLVVVREQGEHPVYAPAHEALFSAWRPLADLLTHREDDLRQRTRLERRAADWRDSGSTGSGLLSGADLDSAEAWQERSSDLVSPDIAAYVAASQARQRRTRIIRTAVVAAIAGLTVALVAVLLVNAADNRRQALEARVAELKAVAELELASGGDPVAAAVAVLEGLGLDPGSEEMKETAADLLEGPARDRITLPGGVPATGTVVGTRLGVVSTASGPQSVDLLTGSPLGNLAPAGAPLAVRPDDGVAVVSGEAGLTWWDLASDSDGPLAQSARWASQAAYSPDGALMVSLAGNVVTLWNVAAPESPGEVESWVADPTAVTAVAVADDGRVYTSGLQATLVAWTPLTGAAATTLVPDPQAPGQGATDLWLDVERGRVLVSKAGVGKLGASVYSLDDGAAEATYVAAAGGADDALAGAAATFGSAMSPADGSVAVFDLAGRGYVFAPGAADSSFAFLEGHSSSVSQPAFTTDGLLVTGSLDGSVRLWDVHSAETWGDGRAATESALCEVFGPRLDEQSIERALDDEPFDDPCGKRVPALPDASLTLSTAAPEGVVSDAALAADDFADPYTLFPDETFELGGGATSERRVRAGRLLVSTRGAEAGYNVWAGAVVLSRAVTSGRAEVTVSSAEQSTCGLTLGDGVRRVNVMLEPTSGTGRIVSYETEAYTGDGRFAAGPAARPSAARTLSLSLEEGTLVTTVDGTEVDRRTVDLGSLGQVGPASEGGRTDCEYDDFAVTVS